MKKLLVQHLRPGMVVARTVYSLSGTPLLKAGIILNQAYIDHLHQKGVPALYIKDEQDDFEVELEAEAEDVVSEETRLKGLVTVKEVMGSIKQVMEGRRARFHGVNEVKVQSLANEIVDQILSHRDLAVNLSDIRGKDEYNYAHSIQVGILSIMTGMTLGYDQNRLRDLGIGAILHDIGKVRVAESIVNKQVPLTPQEYEIMKRHPEYGFDIIRQQTDFSILSAHVAFQHHERFNGNGYPRGIKAEEIHEYGRIVAVVDAYDALTCDRPFRTAYLPHEAVEMLMGAGNFMFDFKVVRAFVDNIALYPVGTLVELSDGFRGMVIAASRKNNARPKVRLFWDPLGARLTPPTDIDLLDKPNLVITKVYNSSQEVPQAARS